MSLKIWPPPMESICRPPKTFPLPIESKARKMLPPPIESKLQDRENGLGIMMRDVY